MSDPQSTQRVSGLCGWSGSGKTTLILKLIAAVQARGFSVSTMKHAHHSFDIDRPGKDSHRHRGAGAREVLITSAQRWALMHENHDQPEPSLQALLARMSAVDLVLVEGFKRQPHPKMEIHRPSLGKPLLYPDDPSIVAIACSAGLSTATIPHFDIDDVTGITDFMLATVGLTATEGAA